MQYRMLDLLACPLDGHFPLELREPVTAGHGSKNSYRCRAYCGFKDQPVSGGSATDCDDCRGRGIETATLVCPGCNTEFPVEDGIPRLIPPSFLHSDSLGSDVDDKKKEMMTRDRAARRYDSMKSLAMLSRIEKPVTLSFVDLNPGEIVAELGSGTGRFTLDLADAASEVVAVDFSVESLKVCREKRREDQSIHPLQADISHLPLRSGLFDKAVSCQVFEHLPSAEMRLSGLKEASRVLKDDGELTISVYGQFWFSKIFGKKEGYHAGDIYYFRHTPAEFKSFLSKHFEILVHRPNVGNYLQLARCRKLNK